MRLLLDSRRISLVGRGRSPKAQHLVACNAIADPANEGADQHGGALGARHQGVTGKVGRCRTMSRRWLLSPGIFVASDHSSPICTALRCLPQHHKYPVRSDDDRTGAYRRHPDRDRRPGFRRLRSTDRLVARLRYSAASAAQLRGPRAVDGAVGGERDAIVALGGLAGDRARRRHRRRPGRDRARPGRRSRRRPAVRGG